MQIVVEAQKVGAMGACRVWIYRNERVLWRTSEGSEWAGHPEWWRPYLELEMTDASEVRADGGVTHYGRLPEFTLEATNRRERQTENRFDDVPAALYAALYEYPPEGYPAEAPGRSGFLPLFENLAVPESLGPRSTYAALIFANRKPKPAPEEWPQTIGV